MTNPTTTSTIDIASASFDENEATFVPAPNRKSRQQTPSSSTDTVLTIPVDRLKVIKNVRTTLDKKGIEQLAHSIRIEGQLSPIVVQKLDDDSYGIVFGHRRHAAIALNAAKYSGDGLIRCSVRNNISADDLPFVQLAENMQREDMRDSETALTLAQLKTDRNMSIKELAARVSLSERQVRTYVDIGLAPDFIRGFLDVVEVNAKVKDETGKPSLSPDGSPVTEIRHLAGLSMDKVAFLIKHHAELADAEALFIKTTPAYKPKAEKQIRALAQQCAAGEWTKQQLAERIKKLRSPGNTETHDADAERPAYAITKQVIRLDIARIKALPQAERLAMAAALQAALVAMGADVFQSVDIRGA